MNKFKVISFQHTETEDLEKIEEYLHSLNFSITKVKFYKNEKIPKNLDQFCLMIVLGGPMNVWMEEKHPWLIEEKKAIKKFVVELKKPFIGICLGCQLLGEVLGGKVVKSKKPEIGFFKVFCKKIIATDLFINFLPKEFYVFQWHNYEVSKINSKEINVLAETSNTKNQIFRYGKHAYGIQFHIEVDLETIIKWSEDVDFKKKLKNLYGQNIKKAIKENYTNEIEMMNLYCKKFIKNLAKYVK